jgi:hypothetical protein
MWYERVLAGVTVLGAASLMAWSCTGSTPRDINFGTDAGAGFEAPTGTGGETGAGGGAGAGGAAGLSGTGVGGSADGGASDGTGDSASLWMGAARTPIAALRAHQQSTGPRGAGQAA